METLFQDRHQHVDRNRAPDLGDDGILGSAEEGFDPKVLFDLSWFSGKWSTPAFDLWVGWQDNSCLASSPL